MSQDQQEQKNAASIEAQPADQPAAAETSAAQDSPAAEQQLSAQQALQERCQQMEQQLRDEQEKFLRCYAEMDNLRKRTARELSQARQYALEPFATPLLEVRDNLERSLSSGNGQSLDAMRTGVELTLKILSDLFLRFDIEEVAPNIGESFDPQSHEAMSTMPSSDHPPNVVVDLVQKGYRLHQRLLRPALVIVSAAAPAGADDADKKS